MDKINKVQKELDKLNCIVLSGFSFAGESLEDFILNFLKDYNFKCRTEDAVTGQTISVPSQQWRRSKGDIYRLCKTYFPDVTLKDVLKTLYCLYEKSLLKELYCNHISKRVWMSVDSYNRTSSYYYTPYEIADEDGIFMNDLKALCNEDKELVAQ